MSGVYTKTMFRRFTERWFGVKNKHQAAHFKQRLSLVYAFVAWNCFGVMLYSLLKKEMPNGNPSERSTFIFYQFFVLDLFRKN